MKYLLILSILFAGNYIYAQSSLFSLSGKVVDTKGTPVELVTIAVKNSSTVVYSDAKGEFVLNNLSAGAYTLVSFSAIYKSTQITVKIPEQNHLNLRLSMASENLDEVVVTGTMKEMNKDDSPVNVDIVTPQLFQKTSTANLFEASSLVNGVKPQINCNVCNTGDIHINGMEGPYTLILIDGMPIVSGLSTVYGLMGIPASMIERMEIAKGPAGALYGSEAMGGTMNVITKKVKQAPDMYLDYYATTYLENNLDLSTKIKLSPKINNLLGANTYWYNHAKDLNKDGFTDVTMQKRISLFNKISMQRNEDKEFSIAGRFVYEDRWGGQMNYEPKFRGGDSVYGESIYVKRFELISNYEWPCKEKIFTQLSYNFHDQNSMYGQTSFIAKQSTAFAQTYLTKTLNYKNEFLAGISYKNLWFDDNTTITQTYDGKKNQPDNSNTLGAFVQNETTFDRESKFKLLTGFRIDYHSLYQFIPSPRIAFKYTPTYKLIFRLNAATGFRVVNVFTEDHAALTGAREVVFVDKIQPEKSYNITLNTIYKMKFTRSTRLTWDATLFYYYFTNKIVANYDNDPNKVIYDNLNGYAFSKGFSVSAALVNNGPLKFTLGTTYANVMTVNKDSLGGLVYTQQLQSPKWSGNIIVTYTVKRPQLVFDVTGNWYGPQRLPVLPNDYRPQYSPWYCLLNLQISKSVKERLNLYVGVKNLFNFLPKDPIMRPQDPFDKQVMDPVSNPNGYTFDPSYNYAPMQGIRAYLGFRISVN